MAASTSLAAGRRVTGLPAPVSGREYPAETPDQRGPGSLTAVSGAVPGAVQVAGR
jgi:hypothetical protein